MVSKVPLNRAFQWLERLKNHEISGLPSRAGTPASTTWNLQDMMALLRHLKKPQEKIKNVVHVVGTKGKGSTAAMLDCILTQAGYKVGRYTSPHLVWPGERIMVDGNPMSWDELNSMVHKSISKLDSAISHVPNTTYFEALTALAIQHFADSSLDWVIMEAGVGGATDATNVFSAEQVKGTVITALGEEHMEVLGGSIESIAAAKAGIVHPGTTAIIAPQLHSDASPALSRAIRSIPDTKPVWVPEDAFTDDGISFSGSFRQHVRVSEEYDLFSAVQTRSFEMPMIGYHNIMNSVAAVSAIATLCQNGHAQVSPMSYQRGLGNCRMAGRFDVRWQDTHRGWWLCLDTAHTVEACDALVRTVGEAFCDRPPCAIIFTVAADKNLEGMASSLIKLCPSLVVCVDSKKTGLGERGVTSENIVQSFRAQLDSFTDGAQVTKLTSLVAADSIDEALQRVNSWIAVQHVNYCSVVQSKSARQRAPLVCATGSNSLVGGVMESLHLSYVLH